MIRILCLIATEDRLWNMKRALRRVEEIHPGMIEGHCWSAWGLAANPEEIPQMLADAQCCDFAIVYFHGGAQLLPDFESIWKLLTARMPVYFESSLPEEIAELLPQSGLNEAAYQSIRRYFRLADEYNFTSMLLHIAKHHFDMDCTVPEPRPILDDGFYTLDGILTQEDAEHLRRCAFETEKIVVGLILHQTQVNNGNTRHIDAMLQQLEKLDVVALPMFTRMANDEDDKRGIRHAMDRYFMWEGKRLPDVILVMAGFSMTHMGWPGDGYREVTESIFAGWDVPAIQVMATRMLLRDYEARPQGVDSMSLTNSIFQPELDGQIISVPCAAQEVLVEDGVERKVFVPMADRVERVCKLAVNWAKLRKLPQSEKKIAILL